jgi:hypothetical protein
VTTVERIRIPDLLNPVLNAAQQAALDEADRTVFDPTVDAVLAEASRRTRLDDFGPRDFEERLALLLGEAEWPGHTRYAQLSAYRRMVNKATDRLLAIDLLKRHPEIEEEPIDAPIFVAGLPRSGTTHLLNLIAADSRFQSLPYWQVLRPVPLDPEDAIGADGVDPRRRRAQEAWEQLQGLNPYQRAHHPMDPDHVSEDGELQMADFSSYVWEFSLRAPGWRDYYYAHDQTPHHAYEKRMLQILQWQRGDRKRWIVKAPQHLEQLRPIMSVFPDALVVVTHRDPVASLQSILTIRAYTARIRERELDVPYDLSYWAERYGHLLDAYLRDVVVVPAEQRFDCLFRELVSDDLHMVERIYEAAGVSLTDAARRDLAEYASSHRRGRDGRLVFDLRGDFGAEPRELRERYREYTKLVPVGIEVE